MPHIVIDPESKSLGERFAVVKTTRKNRNRYPAGCVSPVTDEQEAREHAKAAQDLRPAIVYGPSASSEGQRVYYLVRWLD